MREHHALLTHALKRLNASWDATIPHWKDERARIFQRDHLAGLPEKMKRASVLMETLDAQLKKFRDACE